jgi:uncharacterized protein (DUF58 family)
MTSPIGAQSSPRVLHQRARNALRRLEWQLRRRRVTSALIGEHRSIFRGRSMEFDQVVKYAFGDDIRDVDWNVTARLGDIYRKIFVEEREITVFVVVSDDPALQFGSGEVSKRDLLLDLAGLVMMLASVNRERAALLHLTPAGKTLHPPTRRRARIMAAIAALFEASAPDPGLKFVSSPLMTQRLPKDAMVVWLGEVPAMPPPSDWPAMRSRHQVIGIRVEDEWERTGPRLKNFVAYDPNVQDLVWVDGSPAGQAAHQAWRERRESICNAWWPDPADRLVVNASADPLDALVRFLRSRGGRGGRPATHAR